MQPCRKKCVSGSRLGNDIAFPASSSFSLLCDFVEDVCSQLPALASTLPAAVPPVLMGSHPSESVSPNKPCLPQGPWVTCLVTAREQGLSQS